MESKNTSNNKVTFEFKTSQKIYLPFKRLIAIFGSLIGIVLLIIPMIVISIIIKCSSKGPIFFKQKRIGKNRKVFTLIKFRSMRVDAPEIAPSDMSEEQQKAMQYRFGNFLRKTSLDEIPQLFNIFKGDMAFVGPRPGAAHNEEDLINARLSFNPSAYEVKPGLTGFAQLIMHRDHNPELKAKYDSEYVTKVNFWFDVKLFLKTIFCRGGGAR